MLSKLNKKGYDQAAESYTSKRNQSDNIKYLEKLNHLLSPKSKILDIGCGGGKPVDSFFISKGHHVIGIDNSEKMVAIAKKNVPKADYKIVDMEMLNEHEYQVDAVVSFYAIFHIERNKHFALFQNIHSFLPLNGLLLVTMGRTAWEGAEEFHGAKIHWSHFDAITNRQLIERSGFEIIFDEEDGPEDDRHQFILAKKIQQSPTS